MDDSAARTPPEAMLSEAISSTYGRQLVMRAANALVQVLVDFHSKQEALPAGERGVPPALHAAPGAHSTRSLGRGIGALRVVRWRNASRI